MNILRAVIIDDEWKAINSLRSLIERFISDVEVVAKTTDSCKGPDLIRDFNPDIVFLDIKMPRLDGFSLLDRIKNREFSLIFVTAQKQHAIKAIRNNALDYLLKPVDIEELKLAIDRARTDRILKARFSEFSSRLQALRSSNNMKLPFCTREKVEYICKNNVVRLESDSNYTYVHLLDGSKLTISRTIGDYESQLCNPDIKFMRIHQSHIVNLMHVTRYLKDKGYIIMSDNSHLPLSRNKRDEFVRWLDL